MLVPSWRKDIPLTIEKQTDTFRPERAGTTVRRHNDFHRIRLAMIAPPQIADHTSGRTTSKEQISRFSIGQLSCLHPKGLADGAIPFLGRVGAGAFRPDQRLEALLMAGKLDMK